MCLTKSFSHDTHDIILINHSVQEAGNDLRLLHPLMQQPIVITLQSSCSQGTG